MPTLALLGGECTGKTSLAALLAETLDGVVVPEELRAFVEQQQRAPEQHEQSRLFAAQQAAITLAQEAHRDRWVICDPAATMTAIYSQIYFGDDTLLNSALAELRAVDAIIWCDIDLPWQSDGIQRDGVHMRQAAHQAIGALLSRSPDLSALLVSGSVAERGAVVQRTLLP